MNRTVHEVVVKPRGLARIRGGHPWIFVDDLASASDAASGDVVRVADAGGRLHGYAFFSRVSKIALRMIGGADRIPDGELWRERLRRAESYRREVVRDADAYRLIFGETDGMPGLVADRYGEHLVVQCLTAGAERIIAELLDPLRDELGIRSVLARNDPAVRTLEGLPRITQQLAGATPSSIDVREAAIRYRVEPWQGQKTGAFLDQRENRVALAPLCRGRVLDVCCYQGGFALQASFHADEVVAIDSSVRALERAREDARRNARSSIRFVAAKAFEELKRLGARGERFDAIVLDPPAFAKSRRDVSAAERAYLELNRRALRLLAPGGILITCSCSYNMSEEHFVRVLRAAAAGERRTARVTARCNQARDHPVVLGFPESLYLKCLVLSVW